MNFNNIKDIEENGFFGFKTVEELWSDKESIPKIKGVYLVLNKELDSEFIYPGVGGFFKGDDPNISIKELNNNYIKDSLVVYIGKAGGPTSEATLHSRLGQYLSFGRGKKVGHRGGRLIWQLKCHKDLVFCWKPIPDDDSEDPVDPREIEKSLIEDYITQFDKMPFANLVR